MNPVCFMSYFQDPERNMLETCVASLKAVRPDVLPVIVADDVPDEMRIRFQTEYGVFWWHVPPSRTIKRRAACKIEELQRLASEMADGTCLLVSDVDVYFKADPFVPFAERPDMDLGVTTRGYDYPFPINAGVFFVRLSSATKAWLEWHVREMHETAWPPYASQRRFNNHVRRFGLDWTVGQDFLIACWNHRDEVLKDRGVRIEDVGPKYNYCPAVDTMKGRAFELIRQALNGEDVSVVHLKSDLKNMIYEPGFPNAKLNYPKGRLAWL